MPTIYDNIEQQLIEGIKRTADTSNRADFCVGYFNLRGWQYLEQTIEQWTGDADGRCRLLVGMQRAPADELQAALGRNGQEGIDNKKAIEFKQKMAADFRSQLLVGIPTNEHEATLQRLARQLRGGKVIVKLFLRHQLHAKLYLFFRDKDYITPIVGFLGSSNLTFSGLSRNGELNVDVLEQDAAAKLVRWFNDRWEDQFCIDISAELAEIIEESWAGEKLIPPYHVYLKMAYHLSQEARAGLSEFTIPHEFQGQLFDFQTAAVKLAARHLNQRGGVLIADVVGLGKTIMATAVAKIFQEDYLMDALIICPKNLKTMWEWYCEQYRLQAKVIATSEVQKKLKDLRRYRLVLIDESHNLRNREGKRYDAIHEYIKSNECRCILLSATPYNKTYLDLSNQLRLFVPEETDLGIRPEKLLGDIGEVEFSRRYQASTRTLAAFEKSENPDDWRELMSLFMVRRTRSFIRDNYTHRDPLNGRQYLRFPDGNRAYFPDRLPRRVNFKLDENNPNDPYARLYSQRVVDIIGALHLSRYGLGNYEVKRPSPPLNDKEKETLKDLTRGGRRLIGFSRTNLFKRLESSGYAFLLSVERHILRNFVFIHALENDLPLPIGTQDTVILDTRFEDEDPDDTNYAAADLLDDESGEAATMSNAPGTVWRPRTDEAEFRKIAADVYNDYWTNRRKRFKWLRANLFEPKLQQHLLEDALALLGLLREAKVWAATDDEKLKALASLLREKHPTEKVLVFSQFADTVDYLATQLPQQGIKQVAGVTGTSKNPTAEAWRFSPVSNNHQVKSAEELRVLLATDVLSEGQNLQDAHIIVNYDLPWAIIRLIQRVGRVDRIGQLSSEILSYTFWPAEGVERLIRLRERLQQRLAENQEVVGSDEAFFEDDESSRFAESLYNEKSSVLDADPDGDVDLVSYAYEIWKHAADANPEVAAAVEKMPSVVYATKELASGPDAGQPGALVFMRTNSGQNTLAWIDEQGKSVTESQFTILQAARCTLDTPAQPRRDDHHELVGKAVDYLMSERSAAAGGQLGRPSGARFRTYSRLKHYLDQLRRTLWATHPNTAALEKALGLMYNHPLREAAREKLNRQLRMEAKDEQLTELVITLYESGELCNVSSGDSPPEAQIICSMGLLAAATDIEE